jgi:thioredoxin 1
MSQIDGGRQLPGAYTIRKVPDMAESANLMEFTTANWEQEVLKSDKPVLVDFWAPWCGPCRMLSPIVDRLATQFAGQVKVGKLNVDDEQEVAVRYGVMSIPRVFIFKNGEQKQSLLGLRSESELTQAIKGVLEGK